MIQACRRSRSEKSSRSDRAIFREIERKTTPPAVLNVKGSAESQYFLSGWQKIYARFTGYTKWIKAVETSGETIGFLCASFQDRQRKGLLIQPMVAEDCLNFLPAMLHEAGTWLEQSGRESMIVEIPDQWTKIRDTYLSMVGRSNIPGWSLSAGWTNEPS